MTPNEEEAYLAGVIKGRREKGKPEPKPFVPVTHGGILRPPAYVEHQMAVAMRKLVTQMTRETKAELSALFRSPEGDVQEAVGMDASIADMANIVIEKLLSKFTLLFDKAALSITSKMMGGNWSASTRSLDASLKETSKRVTLIPDERTKQLMDAATLESVGLIKRVPADYLPMVQGDVMRSITSGNGLQDLVPELEKRNVKVKNWATNVARDQTRKAYSTINRSRAVEAGAKKWQWIHSGGANEPRLYHLRQWPAGLNGGIFTFDDPPIIDEKTGERGFPAQLPYCGCTYRLIFDLEEL